MLCRPDNANSFFAKLAFVVCLTLLCVLQAFPSNEPSSVTLKIRGNDGEVKLYRGYPETVVKLLFPAGEAIFVPDSKPQNWRLSHAPILKKVVFGRVYDTKRRFNVFGASFGERLFIFDKVFGSENSVTMSQFIRATGSDPSDEAEALVLAKLYLALSYYRLENPSGFIAHKSSYSANTNGSENQSSNSEVNDILQLPKVVRQGGTFSVEFYAYDSPGFPQSGASHWQISIGPGNLEERLSAHHDDFYGRFPKAASDKARAQRRINFAVTTMGNGFTSDGAETDIQNWDSSDGPGVQRIHYYYKSHEKAERRMQDFLQNAVATVDNRPWRSSGGSIVGTQARVITMSYGKLVASQLYEDETSVLEFSCATLDNLAAALDLEPPNASPH